MFSALLCALPATVGPGAHADRHGFLTASASTYSTSSNAFRTSWSPSRSLNNTGCAIHIDSVSQHPFFVPTTHVYRHDVSRPRSWCSLHDSSGKISSVSQGTVAPAPAWVPRLVHSVGPSYPYGYRVRKEPCWTTCAGRGRRVRDDPCVPLPDHTPRDNASNELYHHALVPSRMDVIMRMNMTASRRLDTGPDTVDPVVFRHLGALDGCFDFQRYPPRWLPPCEVRRGLYAWVRRISDAEQKRNERAYFAARRRAREQLKQWAHNFTAHHIALRVAENATAVVRTIFHPVIALSCAAA